MITATAVPRRWGVAGGMLARRSVRFLAGVLLTAITVAGGVVPDAWAQGKDDNQRFSVGLTVGNYDPDLRRLNATLAEPGRVILQDPNFLIPQNQNLPVGIRDVATPELSSRVNYGLEAQWKWHPRVSFLVMALNWQGRSLITDTISMQLRSNLPPLDVPRTARYNLNINQLWLGWRYSVFDRPGKARLFLNMGVAGYSVVDFTIDTLLKVENPPEQGVPSFASISSVEFSGNAFSSRYGAGGEVYITRNVSLGFHVNYIFGELQRFRVQRFFPSGFSEQASLPAQSIQGLPDNVLPNLPALPEVSDQLQGADITIAEESTELVDNPGDIELDLDGWEFALALRVYY